MYASCERCGGVLKPDVVFFGENAHRELVEQAFAADALLVLGSSLSVQSGMRFVRKALKDGQVVMVAEDGPTRPDDRDIVRLHGRLEELPPLGGAGG